MKNKPPSPYVAPPSPYVAPPSAAPLPVMHPDYPEFPLHKKKDPSGMTKPVRQLFAEAKSKQAKKGGKKSRKSRKSRKMRKSRKH